MFHHGLSTKLDRFSTKKFIYPKQFAKIHNCLWIKIFKKYALFSEKFTHEEIQNLLSF